MHLLVRNLSGAARERLRKRALQNGRSLEAEAKAILKEAARLVVLPSPWALRRRVVRRRR